MPVLKELKRECYEIIATLYVQLGQAPEAEIVVQMTNLFCNDLATNYGSMELDEVKFALNKHIRENDGPHFVNVPTWNEALRSYKMTKAKSLLIGLRQPQYSRIPSKTWPSLLRFT